MTVLTFYVRAERWGQQRGGRAGQDSATERAPDQESQSLPSSPAPALRVTLGLGFHTSSETLGPDALLVHELCSASYSFIHSFIQPACTVPLPGARLRATARELRSQQGPNYKVGWGIKAAAEHLQGPTHPTPRRAHRSGKGVYSGGTACANADTRRVCLLRKFQGALGAWRGRWEGRLQGQL